MVTQKHGTIGTAVTGQHGMIDTATMIDRHDAAAREGNVGK